MFLFFLRPPTFCSTPLCLPMFITLLPNLIKSREAQTSGVDFEDLTFVSGACYIYCSLPNAFFSQGHGPSFQAFLFQSGWPQIACCRGNPVGSFPCWPPYGPIVTRCGRRCHLSRRASFLTALTAGISSSWIARQYPLCPSRDFYAAIGVGRCPRCPAAPPLVNVGGQGKSVGSPLANAIRRCSH